MKLNIATGQFPIDGNIRNNLRHIESLLRKAKRRQAHLVHLPECCLSGYAGFEFESFTDYDWELLRQSMQCVMNMARSLRLWVIVGSSHYLSPKLKPHNSLYIINDKGRLIDRYDKMFCTGGDDRADLKHYSPGDHFTTFEVRGIKCGTLICYDSRFPELYREYKRRGVQVMFHSYYHRHIAVENSNTEPNILGVITPPTMQTYAACNAVWISACNTSARQSAWASFVVHPDGVIACHLRRNRAGLLVTTVDTNRKFYDAPGTWRHRALSGVNHSGELVSHERSRIRTEL